MPRATYTQSSFLGGEWSPQTQGRFDREDYRTGMNVCRNVVPNEEGSGPRRPGTRFLATTRSGAEAVLREFHFDQAAPYLLEFSASHLRFFASRALVLKNEAQTVLAISTATPAVVTVGAADGWTTGDQVSFILQPNTVFAGVGVLINRQFTITVVDTQRFSLADAVTGLPFDGSLVTLGPDLLRVDKVLDFSTPYATADLDAIRVVQDQDHCLSLHGSYPMRLVASEDPTSTDNFATFDFRAATLLDGPYYDAPQDGSSLTIVGTTGIVTVTASYTAYSGAVTYKAGDSVSSAGVGYLSLVNNNTGHAPAVSPTYWQVQSAANGIGPNGFTTTDVGRHMRLFYEPLEWSAATAYAVNATVKFDDAYYIALTASTGKSPDTSLDDWGVATTAAAWTWGIIVSRLSATQVTLQITGDDLISDGIPIKTYRMGLYSDTTGYPHHGVFHDGRLWLAGPVKNRLDGSMSNQPFTFSPTTKDGTVADNNGCAVVIKAKRIQSVRWLLSTDQGILVGTQGGEWLLHASQQNDPITPTSVQQNQVTQHGCEDVEPVLTPNAAVFVQRYGRKLIEYTAIGAAKYAGANISNTGKHLIVNGLDEIAYQTETSPVIWGRSAGALVGCTYKRELPIGTQPPSFVGWSRHDLGSGRSVRSLCVGPDVSGDVDALSLVTYDPNAVTRVYFVETLTNFLQDTLLTSWYVDAGTQGAIAEFINANTIRFYGLRFVAGQTVDVWLAGLDLGSHTVTVNGYLDVDLATDAEARLTAAYLATLTANYAELAVRIRRLPTGATTAAGTVTGSYLTTGSVGAVRTDIGIADWTRNRLFTFRYGDGTSPDAGIRSFNLSTRAVAAQALVSSWVGGSYGSAEIFTVPPIGVAPASGDLYFQLANGKFKRVSGSTLAIVSTSAILTIDYLISMRGHDFNGSDTFLCTTLLGGSSGPGTGVNLNLFSGGATMAKDTTLAYQLDLLAADTVAGPKGTNYCVWYVLEHGGRYLNQGANVNPVTLRAVTKGVVTSGITTLATLAPSDIQADWTHWDAVLGLAYDQSDGCVIAFMEQAAPPAWNSGTTYRSTDVATLSGNVYRCILDHTNHTPPNGTYWVLVGPASYVNSRVAVKINPTTGRVVWATPGMDSRPFSNVPESLSNSNITGGGLSWLSTTDHGTTDYYVYHLSSAGVLTSTTVHHFGINNFQLSNDVTGDLVGHFAYTFDGLTNNPTKETTTVSYSDWGVLRGAPGGVPYNGTASYNVPAALGYTYPSQWQILRPNAPNESGTQIGPGFAKTRRSHRYGALVHNTKGLTMGTDFVSMRPVAFASDGGVDYTTLQLFSGLVSDTLEDGYSYDSMLACQITRPYPGTILTLGAFDQTQDR